MAPGAYTVWAVTDRLLLSDVSVGVSQNVSECARVTIIDICIFTTLSCWLGPSCDCAFSDLAQMSVPGCLRVTHSVSDCQWGVSDSVCPADDYMIMTIITVI
jgi:hypothetical protein